MRHGVAVLLLAGVLAVLLLAGVLAGHADELKLRYVA